MALVGEAGGECGLCQRHAFADQAAVALENARLYERQVALHGALRNRQARLEALLEVGRQLARIQPVESHMECGGVEYIASWNALTRAFATITEVEAWLDRVVGR